MSVMLKATEAERIHCFVAICLSRSAGLEGSSGSIFDWELEFAEKFGMTKHQLARVRNGYESAVARMCDEKKPFNFAQAYLVIGRAAEICGYFREAAWCWRCRSRVVGGLWKDAAETMAESLDRRAVAEVPLHKRALHYRSCANRSLIGDAA